MKNYIIQFIIVFIILLFISSSLYSQTKPNSIYFELLGNGGIYSLNYDRMFNESFGGRIGISYLSELNLFFSSLKDFLVIPLMLNYFVGSENHKLELGGGIIYLSISGGHFLGFENNLRSSGVAGTATIGYRYQQTYGGFLFRIGFTPFFSSEGFVPYGGISFGFSF